MKPSLKISVVLGAFGLTMISGHASNAAGDWEKLGCRTVGFAVDHDTINVDRPGHSYNKFKLRVRLAPIEFYKVRVVFGNGGTQDISINKVVRAGTESFPVDLKGDARAIAKVNLLYRSIPNFKGKAEVCVIGKLD